MAYTWTTVPLTELASGKKVKAEHALAFYNNVFAMAEGAAGAPKVQFPALDLSVPTYLAESAVSATAPSAATVYTLIPAGVHVGVFDNITPGLGSCTIEIYANAAWRTQSLGTGAGQSSEHFATVISDGTNVRIGTAAATGSTITFNYKTL